jgi:hypothetical protein
MLPSRVLTVAGSERGHTHRTFPDGFCHVIEFKPQGIEDNRVRGFQELDREWQEIVARQAAMAFVKSFGQGKRAAPGSLPSCRCRVSSRWHRHQAVQALWIKNSDAETRDRKLSATVAALVGIGPKDELEGMIAAQLIAAHDATMECYRRAMIGEQSFEGRRENLTQANKLSRTYAALIDALNRHRGKGQQTVRVEHVHVHSGGQAIVGMVERRGEGLSRNQRNNPMQLPMHRASKCRARTRIGQPCQAPATPNGRCRMHGGKSPGAPKGNKNAFKHGRYTAETKSPCEDYGRVGMNPPAPARPIDTHLRMVDLRPAARASHRGRDARRRSFRDRGRTAAGPNQQSETQGEMLAMNGTKLTLPAEAGGTEITRFNALRHGVLSRYTVLPWEDAEEYSTLVAALAAEHAPQGPTEEHLVEELAGILWRKRRLRLAEAATHHRGLEDTLSPFRGTKEAALDAKGEQTCPVWLRPQLHDRCRACCHYRRRGNASAHL